MLNMFTFVGRIESFSENSIGVKVKRQFKNDKGIYETDVFQVILLGSIKDNTHEYCKINDFIGVKGRLQVENGKICLIADKVSFLSSKEQ